MATSPRRRSNSASKAHPNHVPAGAWYAREAVWNGTQRVRLVTGPLSLVGEAHERIRSVHAVLFTEEDALLLVQNKDGSYTFPGGRLEERETIDEALRREMWEEARARVAPGYVAFAVTEITFLNRVPGRLHRVHPTFLLWVLGRVAALSDEPHLDPADYVVGRRVARVDEARALLPAAEGDVLEAALKDRKERNSRG